MSKVKSLERDLNQSQSQNKDLQDEVEKLRRHLQVGNI